MAVFTARKIVTMVPSQPEATAVAVQDGKIVEVGSLETMRPWLDARPHEIDNRFKDHVLMPGFIDPHLHPSMAAILLPCHFITAMEWRLPDRTSPPVVTHEGYLKRLSEIEAGIANPDEVLVTWGFHRVWHGNVDREALNGISETRPIFVWQRSFHEIVANDAAIAWLDVNRGELERHPQIDLETGRFFETGMLIASQAMNTVLLEPERFKYGLDLVRQAVHFGGHTTIGDLAYPLIDDEREWSQLAENLEGDDIPFRMRITPRGSMRGTSIDDVREDMERIRKFEQRGTQHLFFGNSVKLFADGGFFAELMQMQDPGFIDGHHGEWMMEPEAFEIYARAFWMEGKQIHVGLLKNPSFRG